MDKGRLLADRVKGTTEQVDVPGVGAITIRALSRMEVLLAQKNHEGDPLAYERFVLSRAMVDPEMTEKDIAKWQEISLPDEINTVALAVNKLSGIGPGSAKEAYKSVSD